MGRFPRDANELSAIAGIFDREGAPVDRALIRGLTRFLDYCGPDWQDIWCEGGIGFGHALLRTTHESQNERQPASLDGRFWITADARLDGRDELIAEMEKAGQRRNPAAADCELILQAYAAWDAECVARLRGDFAFAIWDRLRKVLFCARDHFGVKPFYYADLDHQFVFSSVLDCVRLHPDISDELNETAVGDFLLLGMNGEAATTSFRDVQRLAPAHTLTISKDEFRLRRYWTPPVDGRLRYEQADDYLEHFKVLLQAAVKDRLRTDRVGVLLSGGLDSGAIATTAQAIAKESKTPLDLRAYTVVYESLLPDCEGVHARETAEFLRIPIRFLTMDGFEPFEGWANADWVWPEPCADPFFTSLFAQMRMISENCRVALSGEGCDNLMTFEVRPYARDLWRRREWARLLKETRQYAGSHSSLWAALGRRAKNRILRKGGASFPSWIAADFARRMRLEHRWREISKPKEEQVHPIVPTAHSSLRLSNLAYLFEHENPGVTREPVEVRYPFLDLRLVNFLLSIPPFPWFYEKALLREAMAGRLPESIRRRPKTPFTGEPFVEWTKRSAGAGLSEVPWSEETSRYVDPQSVQLFKDKGDAGEALLKARPLCLNFWLQSLRRVRYKLSAEARNG